MALASDTRRARLAALDWRSVAEATTVNTARTNRSLRIIFDFSKKDSLAQRILTRKQRIGADLRAGRRRPASLNPLGDLAGISFLTPKTAAIVPPNPCSRVPFTSGFTCWAFDFAFFFLVTRPPRPFTPPPQPFNPQFCPFPAKYLTT